jgi:hypothetical protein
MERPNESSYLKKKKELEEIAQKDVKIVKKSYLLDCVTIRR